MSGAEGGTPIPDEVPAKIPRVEEGGEGASNEVVKHYNAVPERGIAERNKSRIFHLRNINNWVKSMLISDTLERVRKGGDGREWRVLDLCCGKGGDLLKWKKAGIKQLVCADIADVSLEQCKGRYAEMKDRQRFERNNRPLFESEFILADCSKENLKSKLADKNVLFDVCSSQFAIHYGFESEAQARCMLKNASETLKPGGYFIGTIPDANLLMALCRERPEHCFKNEVCKIYFDDPSVVESEAQAPLFGAKFHFHLDDVVNLPEYLVHFPLMEKMLKDYGMELVYKKSFAQVFEEYSREGSEGRGLLGRMKALESYPPHESDAPDNGDQKEYSAAKTRWDELVQTPDFRSDRKIGTMSASEWDVFSLYIVFLFRKKA